jgi:hypothetical protein
MIAVASDLSSRSTGPCLRSPITAAMFVIAGRRRDTMGEDFDAAGRLSRWVFDEVYIPREGGVTYSGKCLICCSQPQHDVMVDI